MRHPLVAIIAASFAALPDDAKTETSVEARMRQPAKGEFIMTVRRATGKTPHELRREAEQRFAECERETYDRQERVQQLQQTNHVGTAPITRD